MRILYHHRTQGDGAEGIHIREMIRAFRLNGHEVELVSVTDRGEDTTSSGVAPKAAGAQRKPLNAKKMISPLVYELAEIAYNAVGVATVSAAVRRARPDFIYERHSLFNLTGSLVGKRKGIRTVLEVNAPLSVERANEPDERLRLRRLGNWFEREAFRRADQIVVVSSPLRDHILSLGIPAEKIHLLPNGVDEERFRPEPKDGSLLARYGIDAQATVIGFSGIFRKWHGLDLLLGAFREIALSAKAPVHLLLVGDGPMREWIDAEVRRAGIERSVTVTGRVPFAEMPRVAGLMDIAVSPAATFYASPMKIIEYMALGKAVVAPATENIRDIVVDGVDGVLFAKESSEALRDALVRLLDDAVLFGDVRRRAREKVVRELNWRENARRVAEWAS